MCLWIHSIDRMNPIMSNTSKKYPCSTSAVSPANVIVLKSGNELKICSHKLNLMSDTDFPN